MTSHKLTPSKKLLYKVMGTHTKKLEVCIQIRPRSSFFRHTLLDYSLFTEESYKTLYFQKQHTSNHQKKQKINGFFFQNGSNLWCSFVFDFLMSQMATTQVIDEVTILPSVQGWLSPPSVVCTKEFFRLHTCTEKHGNKIQGISINYVTPKVPASNKILFPKKRMY